MRTKLTLIFPALLFALSLFLSLPAVGGEFSEPSFPKGMGITLSIPSTARLLKAVDAGVAASTVGTGQPVPSGFILRWAEGNLPFPARDGGMDWEIHFFFPPVLHRAAVLAHAVVIANTSLDEFTRSMESVGATFLPAPDGSLQMRGGTPFPPYIVRDAGDGMLLLAPEPSVLASLSADVKAGWRPARRAAGVLGLAADNPGKWLMSGDFLDGRLSAIRRWLTGEPTPALDGADTKALLAVLDACASAVPALKAELAGIERMGLDIRLDGERLGASLTVKAAPETLLGTMAASASARDNISDSPAGKVGDDSIQLLSTASWEDILPGSEQLLLDCAGALADAAHPAGKEALIAGLRRFLSGGPGESAQGGYYQNETISGANWIAAQDPGALFDASGELVEATGGMLKAFFPGYTDAPVVRMEDGSTVGGVPCRSVVWDSGFMARYQLFIGELAAALHDVPPGSVPVPPLFQLPTILTAVGDDFLVTVSGPDAEKRLDAALRDGDADAPLLDSPAAAQALADLPRRQNALILTDYDFLTGFVLSSGILNSFPGGVPSPEKLKEMLESLEPEFRKTSSLVGVALGGADDRLIADVFIPTDTVGAMIHNFGLLGNAMTGPGTPVFFRDNEYRALAALKSYCVAEVTFQVARQGKVAANTGTGEKGYADNFRNLYFGTTFSDSAANLELIAPALADAFAGPASGAGTVASVAKPAETAVPYHGYLFLEPPGLDFSKTFGLVAYPASFGVTGRRIFFIDDQGMPLEMDLNAREGGLPAEGEMPPPITESERPDVNPALWKAVN